MQILNTRNTFQKSNIAINKVNNQNQSNEVFFLGYATIFDVVDLQGDIIISDVKYEFNLDTKVKLLWQHDATRPIGVIDEVYSDDIGILVRGRIISSTIDGGTAIDLINSGVLTGLSIGYRILDSFIENYNKYITNLDLLEVSVVTFPANPKTYIVLY